MNLLLTIYLIGLELTALKLKPDKIYFGDLIWSEYILNWYGLRKSFVIKLPMEADISFSEISER